MDELREKYLQGNLTEAEKETFEKGLSPSEKAELAAELGIKTGLEDEFRKELRQKVASFEGKRAKTRRINPVYMGFAASLMIAASLVFYLTGDQQPLFEQYYEVYPNYELTVVRGEDDPTFREKAYAAYDAGNYSVAIEAFSKLDKLESADYFFRGVCLIQVAEYEKSLADFERVINSNDGDYLTPSIWYTALIHLKQKNNDQAIPLLEELSNGQSEFAAVSSELLAKLLKISCVCKSSES